MTTVASTLLDFILGLFRDEEAAAAFSEDPEASLAAAGLGDVAPADVHALMPMVADSSPAAYGGHGGRKDDDDCHPRPVKDEDCDKDDGHWHKVWHDDKDDCDDDKKDHHDGGRPNHDYAGHGHEAAVIHNVKYVENNYSHTDVDVDIENAIWAGGDVQAIFGDDNTVGGNGSVVLGEDAELDVDVDIDAENLVTGDNNTVDNEAENLVTGDNNAVDNELEIEDSFNTDIDVENSGNTQSGTGNVVGEENDVETENSGNTVEGDNNAVGEDNEAGTDVDVDLENSGNSITGDGNNVGEDNESEVGNTDVDVEIEESFNEDHSTNTELDVEIEESFNDESVEIEDNAIALGGVANTGDVEID